MDSEQRLMLEIQDYARRSKRRAIRRRDRMLRRRIQQRVNIIVEDNAQRIAEHKINSQLADGQSTNWLDKLNKKRWSFI